MKMCFCNMCKTIHLMWTLALKILCALLGIYASVWNIITANPFETLHPNMMSSSHKIQLHVGSMQPTATVSGLPPSSKEGDGWNYQSGCERMYKEVEELEGQVCLTLKKTDHTKAQGPRRKKTYQCFICFYHNSQHIKHQDTTVI